MMQAATRLGGPASSRQIAPMYWKLWSDWATIAMRIACATKKPDKPLNIGCSASEIMCLAELLKQKQDLLSVCVYGKDSVTCLQVQKSECLQVIWTQTAAHGRQCCKALCNTACARLLRTLTSNVLSWSCAVSGQLRHIDLASRRFREQSHDTAHRHRFGRRRVRDAAAVYG